MGKHSPRRPSRAVVGARVGLVCLLAVLSVLLVGHDPTPATPTPVVDTSVPVVAPAAPPTLDSSDRPPSLLSLSALTLPHPRVVVAPATPRRAEVTAVTTAPRPVPAPPAPPHPVVVTPPLVTHVPVPSVAPRVVHPVQVPVVPTAGHAGLLAIARTLIGVGIPYVYGGKDPASGLDCSGFVWVVLKRAGMSVPYRTSDGLQAWATPITAASAQPGDLVFWPGHVGFFEKPGFVLDNGTSAGPKESAIFGSPTYGRIP